ncbi:hypothetical protein Verru16b_00012 [Lacunisphaera limnophila]|uniref:Uncharacterized protein n=1 Tax=Lacunisphaera limnophila TaxID=1838286 RepID=A0A1I7PHA3_9BACT|nr:hypothetical protein [Lacunisphaera limnophila]AOS42977.1 hypothetical protein Verru16b_00012 [Lacunisphaera limnophila]
MPDPLPTCPLLPSAPAAMDASALSAHGAARDAAFYLTALTYAQHLWQRRLAARAILSLDRALGADLRGDEPELQAWPLPYGPMAWFLRHTPPGVFIGNPRVHFQHLADRMNEPRRDQRRWRTWACWALGRVVRPEFGPDPRHAVIEPTTAEIADRLRAHGLPGEAAHWENILRNCERNAP